MNGKIFDQRLVKNQKMAILLKKQLDEELVLGIWEMQENLDEIRNILEISEQTEQSDYKEALMQADEFGSDKRRLEWLSTRALVNSLMAEKTIIYYNEFGKPFLKDSEKVISISHSNDLIAVIIGKHKKVGIDVEKMSNKIGKVAYKFLHTIELQNIDTENIFQLYLHWSAKEALFKVYGKKDLYFNKNLIVDQFKFTNPGILSGLIMKDEMKESFVLNYFTIKEDYLVVWCSK